MTKSERIALKDANFRTIEQIADIEDVNERLKALHDYANVQNSLAQLKNNKRQVVKDYVQMSCAVAGVVVPAVLYNTWMKRGFQFEKEGTYTSTTFRNMFSKFKPTN